MQDKSEYISELNFCLNLREKKWWCAFWWWTKCSQCAVPYLLYKFISWEILHWDIKKLSLDDWKLLIAKYKITNLSSLK
jgi:hypothetical protein